MIVQYLYGTGFVLLAGKYIDIFENMGELLLINSPGQPLFLFSLNKHM